MSIDLRLWIKKKISDFVSKKGDWNIRLMRKIINKSIILEIILVEKNYDIINFYNLVEIKLTFLS